MQAVITADIVNSTYLKPDDFQQLVEGIKEQFYTNQIEFYRGDSFQVLVEAGSKAFLNCLLSRFKALSLTANERIDIRQSISLGTVKGKINHLGSHMEDIFVSSGRTFDMLSDSGRKLLINCGIKELDFSYELIGNANEYVVGIWCRLNA
jgi:hypothetical protein